MNKVLLIGRLTRDPEIRWTQGQDQKCTARYTIAVDRHVKAQDGQQTADFISCVSFGKTAEFVEKYLKQGIKIAAEGRIHTGSYTNRDGQKVYTTDVVVDTLEFAESKNSGNGSSTPAEGVMGANGFMTIEGSIDDEFPFN